MLFKVGFGITNNGPFKTAYLVTIILPIYYNLSIPIPTSEIATFFKRNPFPFFCYWAFFKAAFWHFTPKS